MDNSVIGSQDLTMYRPARDELDFRQRLLSDPATMAYNHASGGTIAFPPERWPEWYARWMECETGERFYRYLRREADGAFVGEVSYHYDEDLRMFLCDVLVAAQYRGFGHGGQGLALLCEAAKGNGLTQLCDNIAADNPSVALFLRAGFRELLRNDQYILVEKKL